MSAEPAATAARPMPHELPGFLAALLDFFENTTVEVADTLGGHFGFPEAIEWVLLTLEDHINDLVPTLISPGDTP